MKRGSQGKGFDLGDGWSQPTGYEHHWAIPGQGWGLTTTCKDVNKISWETTRVGVLRNSPKSCQEASWGSCGTYLAVLAPSKYIKNLTADIYGSAAEFAARKPSEKVPRKLYGGETPYVSHMPAWITKTGISKAHRTRKRGPISSSTLC